MCLSLFVCLVYFCAIFTRNPVSIPLNSTTKVLAVGVWDRLTYIYICRMSHELRSLLRESVPYVKIHWNIPKHVHPKFNGYGDNGHRKMWAFVWSTYCTPSVMPYLSTAHARQRDITVHCSQRKVALTSQDNFSCGLRKVLGNLRT
jgi:hypothetical protein